MSKHYRQLSLAQRYQIEVLLQSGKNQKEIARLIAVSASTISRELKRNVAKRGRGAGQYAACNAQRKTNGRHAKKKKHIRFTETMKQTCRQLLQEEKYSPELIVAVHKLEQKEIVSHETIYEWIWKSKRSHHRNYLDDNHLYKHLVHGRRRRKRGNRKDSRGIIPNRVSIEQRPRHIEKRKRIGDMEVDLMIGKDHKQAVLVVIDRKTRKSWLSKLRNKKSETIQKAICRKLINTPWLKTLTFDNDLAFAGHEKIAARLKVKTYFTRPYTSQDKGSVENKIGILRRFIPKKTDLTVISQQQIKSIENKLNNRPVRKFNYQTPNQVFSDQKIALIT